MDLNRTRNSQGLLRSPVSPPKTPPLPAISSEGKLKVDILIDQVNNIRLSDDVITSKATEPYVTWCRNACSNSEILKYAVERLHYYWLSNRTAIVKASLFLCANWTFEVGGLKLRQELLLCLQRDFENRLDLQATSPEQFLNAAAFLIEMYTRIRIENQPMTFMTIPVFQYLEDLLTGDDPDIELFAHLVIGIASTLQEIHTDGDEEPSSLTSFEPLQNLFSKVRSTLTSRNLSSRSRLWLLFIMDVSSSGDFKLPSPALQSFYQDEDNLGKGVGFLLKSLDMSDSPEESAGATEPSHQKLNASVPEPSRQKLNSSVSEPSWQKSNVSVPGPRRQKSTEEERVSIRDQISEINISPKSKEIVEKTGSSGIKKRSPGKSDTFEKRENFCSESFDKRENFRNAFSVDSGKSSKGKGYWLHDDRFDDDDDDGSKDKSSNSISKPRASEGNWRRPSSLKEDKESKSTNNSNWRQPSMNRAQKDNRESAKPSPVNSPVEIGGHVFEEVWD